MHFSSVRSSCAEIFHKLNTVKLLKKNALAHGLYDIYHHSFKIYIIQLPKLY